MRPVYIDSLSMYTDVERELSERFMSALCIVRQAIFEGSPAQGSGLTPALARALLALGKEGRALRIRDLADTLDIKESSASVLADRLIKAGLADKRPSERDSRVALLELSDAGRGLEEALRLHRLERARALLSRVTDGEQTAAIKILESMANHGGKS